jgi:hypothetical protein
MKFLFTLLSAVALLCSQTFAAEKKPLKVFILAGQSNMQGHAKVSTFEHIGMDPTTKPLLAEMLNADGTPKVCERVWISSLGSADTEQTGKLTAGFGASQGGPKIGPEFTFGIYIEKATDAPILLIKTAWGGKSLNTDFRPPSAGPYVFNEAQLATFQKQGKELATIRAAKEKETGVNYRLMIEHVKKVLADIKRVVPGYDAAQGYELTGFVWFQGWNDMVDSSTYPDREKPGGYDAYSTVMAHFIRDVRKDLNTPKLPFVIGVLGVGGPTAEYGPDEMRYKTTHQNFRDAMAAPALLPEFKGNVATVLTEKYWDRELKAARQKEGAIKEQAKKLAKEGKMKPAEEKALAEKLRAESLTERERLVLEKGISNLEFHYLGSAKILGGIGRGLAEAMIAVQKAPSQSAKINDAEMAGYLFAPAEKVPEEFNGGFSLYAAAWPLVETYPGHKFQTGLCGTWMHPQYEAGKKPTEKCYTDIEGGLGWWRDTRFPTTTPKFIMGGVGPNFSFIANGPGYGAGTWEKPRGQYGVAQLSPWLLFPLDGLNLKQGTSGELFGYGYLPLPLTNPKTTTAGKNVPTGNQCWTLFLNTANFKGPAAFFTPFFWSQATIEHPEWAGMLLDSRPAGPNKAIQMETQHVPAILTKDASGKEYARVAPSSFPIGPEGYSTVLHRLTAYKKSALWDDVQKWFEGGTPADGAVKADASAVHKFREGGGSNWSIYPPGTKREEKVSLAWKSFATSFTPDPKTFAYKWNEQLTRGKGSLVTLPEYYALTADGKKSQWTVMSSTDVPADLGLTQYRFQTPKEKPQEPRTTPDDAASCWKKPGPAAGPFKAHLGDGSVVTYYWYRFADQPAMLNADLTAAEREQVQARVEKLHRAWTKDRNYLTPPDTGTLASIDPALVLTPPKGLEIGYVPIATRQELKK